MLQRLCPITVTVHNFLSINPQKNHFNLIPDDSNQLLFHRCSHQGAKTDTKPSGPPAKPRPSSLTLSLEAPMVLQSPQTRPDPAQDAFGIQTRIEKRPDLAFPEQLSSQHYHPDGSPCPVSVSSLSFQDPSGSQVLTGSSVFFFFVLLLLVLYLCISTGWEIPEPESSIGREHTERKRDGWICAENSCQQSLNF